ncbi:AfsR/SARP family transcriptional regulator [Dictyobacter arantiisoli]|uniref:Bacterial transcriptional activator domain-containing protein n=1 Tax=Dictyobacter arantiisoli TaxID=2014874 RepID=A0A5A5T649_9CHLR|nr:BTAD domain-containing putative transcriptional regulator [Dictyobacter arantiisoli]GCF06705.1 hypothetical protein KDI_02690 [Dictyobacter arantiisoli]
MQALDHYVQQEKPLYPYLRVTTLGEFTLTHALPTSIGRPSYHALNSAGANSRKAAITMLKVLLCSPRRRIAKSALIEALWPRHQGINAEHALDTTASVLRRHILYLPEETAEREDSLLQTRRINGETVFLLPDQAWLWVDADALLKLAHTALHKEKQGENPLRYLEAAHLLDKGMFLEDDIQAPWSQRRRYIIDGAQRRVLYHLVDLHMQARRIRQAEELLYLFLQTYPQDEDALCRLILLLAEQGRRQEALHIAHYSINIIREDKNEPAIYTQELARRIQHGLLIREQQAAYRTIQQRSLLIIIAVA